ncbi:U3 small nucleolar RNA-associated protein 11 [Aphelenchoides fujianensis]|nr:U3 small nucleolar RNA-associated protein 11 [Aphelenchoides fujianensis]
MSLNKAQKSMGREHRERDQPANRKRFGLLEKKKDWIQRTRAHQKKKNKLRKLRRNALERNRDEFDYHMVRSQVGFDGVHREAEKMDEEETHVQAVLNDVRDINYVRHKLSAERKKIDKLKSTLHLTDMPKMNTHTIFVEDEEEAANFDPATHFGTTEELVGRKSNRMTAEMLQTTEIPVVDKQQALEVEKQRHNQYSELSQRMAREQELKVVLQKLEVKKEVGLSRGRDKPKLVSRGNKKKAAVFKWKFERKK